MIERPYARVDEGDGFQSRHINVVSSNLTAGAES